MDDEVYEAAAGLRKSIPPYRMNQHYLLTRGVLEETNNILHVAAQHGNAAFISSTLADLDQSSYFALLCQPNSKGETPLHLAAESGDKPTVEALLRAHDDNHGILECMDKKKLCWRERDERGDTPLHRALRFGYDDVAMLLLDRDGDLVSVENNARESAAYLVAVGFCLGFLRKILDPKFNCYCSVSFSGPRGMTVFHPARKLREGMMSDLIKARKELLKVQDEKGKTVLHYAVEENIEAMVKKLVTVDSSLARLHDEDGMTPLHRAASAGFLTVIKTTLELSPQSILEVTVDGGKTALHMAVANKNRSACFVRECLWNTRMKELINVSDNQGNTPLHLALDLDALDVADALLEIDAINWRLENHKGLAPLDLCHSADKIPKSLTREWRAIVGINVDLFLRKEEMEWVSASLEDLMKHQGPYGDTIFHTLARDGDTEMMELIVGEHKSDPQLLDLLLCRKNSRGETPLHMAAAAGNLNFVNAIVNISRGGGVDQVELDIFEDDNEQQQQRDQAAAAAAARYRPWMVKSENGDTPAHKAVRNGHDDVALCFLDLDPSLASCVTDASESLLYLAALHDCFQVVERIVKLAKSAGCGPHGQNPLHAATRSAFGVVKDIEGASYSRMINNYLEAISSATNRTNTPFSHWVGTRLIEKYPGLKNKADNYGKTPLHYAAELGQPYVVKKLLEGDRSAAFMYDNQGYTPLLRAVSTANSRCTHYILEYCPRSIDLRHATSQKTALHLAKLPPRLSLSGCLHYSFNKCMRKHKEMSRLINETDADGNTPLHCAVLESDQDKALLFLSTTISSCGEPTPT